MNPKNVGSDSHQELTNVEKLRGLPWSISSNAMNTIYVQFTFFGSVFVLFLSELGLNKTDIGFLLSLMPFAGLLSLFIAPMVANFGYKRAFLLFYGIRKLVTAFLLLTPWVLATYGSQITFIFVAVIVAGFALSRAIAETGRFPWIQEYVPSAVQGKYTATNNLFATLAGFLAVTVAGYVLEWWDGLTGFMLLIGAGVVFGLLSVWLMSFVPGGAPLSDEKRKERTPRQLTEAIHDKYFMYYLAGAGLIVITMGPFTSFIPLFMRDEVGLSEGTVVLLQSGALLGSMLTSFLWGWAADRYGSKPIMLSGIYLKVLLPFCWLLMPRHSESSLYIALAIAFLQGVGNMGWGIGAVRLLFVSVVPADKKSDYMALHNAWIGIMGGVSQLFGGRILDYAQSLGISGQWGMFTFDSFTPLFIAGIALPIASILLLRPIKADESVTMGQFAGIFFRGNPFLAMSSLIRYQFARDEDTAVHVTEQLGRARNILAIDELLLNLEDPRFNVRFEAIIAISRMEPDARLTEALIKILRGNTPALSVIAAWALGRIGDPSALDPLRQGLDAPFRSIQAHSARSLGTLGDVESLPLLRGRLGEQEVDPGLHMAYVSALGKLGDVESVPNVLDFLYSCQDESLRIETTLALVRITGDEHYFIRLQRQLHDDSGTVISQALSGLKKSLGRRYKNASSPTQSQLEQSIDDCADAWAHGEDTQGISLLGHLLTQVQSIPQLGSVEKTLIQECVIRLGEFGAERLEYMLLALHLLHDLGDSGTNKSKGTKPILNGEK